MDLTVYLAGHVHGDWREDVKAASKDKGLPITLSLIHI